MNYGGPETAETIYTLAKSFPSTQLGNDMRLAVTCFGSSGPTDWAVLGQPKTGLLSKYLDELLPPLVVTSKLFC